MSDPVTIATITITRTFTDDRDDRILVEGDEALSLIDVLGMLRFAEDSVIRERMGEDDE